VTVALVGVMFLGVVVAAIGIMIMALSDGIKDDLKVLLQQLLEKCVVHAACHFLTPPQRQEFLDWFYGDLQEVLDGGGSGLGIALIFLLFTGPYYTWRMRIRRGRSHRR
jgi:hypothetical protein